MEEVRKQIKYLKGRYTELISFCEKENTPQVSDDVRNIAQDIITRLNRLLDNIIFIFFLTKISPELSTELRKKYEKKVQFPVCKKLEDVKILLSRFNMVDLQTKNVSAFSIINEFQPYQDGKEWISYLRKYSNLGHRKLIAQEKKKDISLMLGEVLKISGGASVTMNNCFVNDIPIKHLTIDKNVIEGDLDPRLNPRVEVEITYLLEDDNIDLLWLCKKSLEEIEKIATKFEKIILA
jgi:hypothetical protein